MNKWQLIPKLGISFGKIEITFNDSWQDVCRKLNLEVTHYIFDKRGIQGKILNNILDFEDSRIKFEFNDLLIEILFLGGELYFKNIMLIDLELDDLIQEMVKNNMKVLFDFAEYNYICPELGIYFCTLEEVGGDGTKVDYVGICSTEWELSLNVYEVKSRVIMST